MVYDTSEMQWPDEETLRQKWVEERCAGRGCLRFCVTAFKFACVRVRVLVSASACIAASALLGCACVCKSPFAFEVCHRSERIRHIGANTVRRVQPLCMTSGCLPDLPGRMTADPMHNVCSPLCHAFMYDCMHCALFPGMCWILAITKVEKNMEGRGISVRM